ncbi:MAG: 16S rRNA (adenine(1518)-N(6)/adenine(1519)-N(6))-dimethyltransferase RsmA [Candidatus Dojkabacteria bacterium]|nr:16S rRNA (adenine(1518)-N(6)/adenine(1519)-N(6))-dimethyltransferase RsmA [Candidatus Dojkabacteria bacterium]
MHIFKKSLGQNFLVNNRYCKRIVEILDIKDNDWIIEIGPGTGAITKYIIESNTKLLAIEYDYNLVVNLVKKFSHLKNFYLEYGDILKIKFEDLFKKYNIQDTVKVCGSLPFNISKRIIHRFIRFNKYSENIKIDKCVFVVQEEVAKEFVAKPPSSTLLSMITSIYAKVRKYETISSKNFLPIPKVNGAILEIIPYRVHQINTEEIRNLEKTIKICFSRPRKKIINNLATLDKNSKTNLKSILHQCNIDPNSRAENLNLEQFLELSKLLF